MNGRLAIAALHIGGLTRRPNCIWSASDLAVCWSPAKGIALGKDLLQENAKSRDGCLSSGLSQPNGKRYLLSQLAF